MSSDLECRDYHHVGNDSCLFMKTVDDCALDDGFLNYLTFLFCTLGDKLIGLGLAVLASWLVILFIALGVTADAYFCPALRVIARVLHLSDNIAGVTFLAFGNGAPDIFSAISAVGNAKGGDVGLAFGALFGAGVFVTTVVAGTICFLTPFRSNQRPLLRDIIFFMVAAFAAYVAMYDGKFYAFESIGFIIMYIFYLIVLIGGHLVNRRLKARRTLLQVNAASDSSRDYGTISSARETDALINESGPSDQSNDQSDINIIFPKSIWRSLIPQEEVPWSEKKVIGKILTIFKMPVSFLLHMTVPLVDFEQPENNWNKYLNSFHLFSAPVTISLLTKIGFIKITGDFYVWALVLACGAILCVISLIVTKVDEKPRFHSAYAFLAFVISVVWIYCVANEIVNLLTTFGIVFNISNTILGLTFLAWGNSLSDYVANVVSARQGAPNMGISACYGGPLLNFLMGLGLPFTFATLKNGRPFDIDKSLLQNVIAYFLFGSLVGTLIFIPLNKFFYSRRFGFVLVMYYVIFLVVAILIETKVIG